MGKKARANKKTARKSADKEETVRSKSNLSILSGDGNYFENSNITINQTFGETKQPKGGAPLETEDEAPPRKEKRVTSDTDKENKPKDKELTPPSLGQAGSSKAGTVGKCSNLSTVLENVGKPYKLIRVVIYDVEVKSSHKKEAKKWFPAKFRVMDPSGWAYLTVFDKANGKIFKQGQSIEVSNVKAKNNEELLCNANSVKSSSEPVQILDGIVDKMKKEETFTSLEEIRDGETFKKIKVIISEVGEQQKKLNSGVSYDLRELKVKASRTAEDIETLVAYNLPAKFKYKAGQEVKIPCVKYNDDRNQFQTVGDCVVKKLSDL